MNINYRLLAACALACALVAVPFARSASSATGGVLPPEKLAMLESIQRAQAGADTHAAKGLALPLASIPDPAWPAGIIESGLAPFPSIYEVQNQWQQIVDGQHVSVYAGGMRDDPASGFVAVATTGLDGTGGASPGGIYPTPRASGAVRIVEATGTTLVLVSATGSTFVFDVATRTYR